MMSSSPLPPALSRKGRGGARVPDILFCWESCPNLTPSLLMEEGWGEGVEKQKDQAT